MSDLKDGETVCKHFNRPFECEECRNERGFRVLVCGDRNWIREDIVFWNVQRVFCENYCANPVLIEGEARGADTHGRLAAQKLGIPVLKFPALWDVHGRAAGPIRNQQMLDEGKPDIVLAFHNNIATSKGTADMVRRAKKAGIPVEVITE